MLWWSIHCIQTIPLSGHNILEAVILIAYHYLMLESKVTPTDQCMHHMHKVYALLHNSLGIVLGQNM